MRLHDSPVCMKMLSGALSLVLCFPSNVLAQQPSAQSSATQPPQTTQPQEQNPPATQPQPQQQPGGTTINPSQPPLQPPVTTYPGGQEQQPAQTSSVPEAPQPKQQPQQPVGAATAEKIPTAGGAAAKPAGAAIAPAKQHQTRSLLIKLGAIAAAGVAIGTVVGLSKGSPSKPPGAP